MDDGLREILFLKRITEFFVLECWNVYYLPYQETYLREHYQGTDAEEAAKIANQIFEDISSESWIPDPNEPFCRSGEWQKDTLNGRSIDWANRRFSATAMTVDPALTDPFGWVKSQEALKGRQLPEDPHSIGHRRRLSSLAR